jgi:hypothetical protein
MYFGRRARFATGLSGSFNHLRTILNRFIFLSSFGFSPQEFLAALSADPAALEDGFFQSDDASSILAPRGAHLSSFPDWLVYPITGRLLIC